MTDEQLRAHIHHAFEEATPEKVDKLISQFHEFPPTQGTLESFTRITTQLREFVRSRDDSIVPFPEYIRVEQILNYLRSFDELT